MEIFFKNSELSFSQKIFISILESLKGLLTTGFGPYIGKSFLSLLLPVNPGFELEDFLFEGSVSSFQWLMWTFALIIVLGHCYPPWRFVKKRSGILPALGALIILSPWCTLGGLFGGLLAYYYHRHKEMAQIAGALTAALFQLVLSPVEPYFCSGAALLFLLLLRQEPFLNFSKVDSA